jgi:hypothetical protein
VERTAVIGLLWKYSQEGKAWQDGKGLLCTIYAGINESVGQPGQDIRERKSSTVK